MPPPRLGSDRSEGRAADQLPRNGMDHRQGPGRAGRGGDSALSPTSLVFDFGSSRLNPQSQSYQ